jgi:riboflavin synthase
LFTGIVEELGRLENARMTAQGGRLEISCPRMWKELSTGESVAVNGVCLTVVRAGAGLFAADVSEESLRRTNLGMLRRGEAVNLERALTLQSRLGGHLVQGHVDDVGTVKEARESGAGRVFTFAAPPGVLAYLVEKCSIAVDGVSLTVVAPLDDGLGDEGDEGGDQAMTLHGRLQRVARQAALDPDDGLEL